MSARYTAACDACGVTLFTTFDELPARNDLERIARHERGHAEAAIASPIEEIGDEAASR